MAHVFVSYARADRDLAERKAADLSTPDVDVWLDRDGLRPGQPWQQGIDAALSDAVAVLVVLTPRSGESAFVTYEWAYALGAGVRVVPLVCEPTESHPRLGDLQVVDLTTGNPDADDDWARLVADLRYGVIGRLVADYLRVKGFERIGFEGVGEHVTKERYPDEDLRAIARLCSDLRESTLKGAPALMLVES